MGHGCPQPPLVCRGIQPHGGGEDVDEGRADQTPGAALEPLQAPGLCPAAPGFPSCPPAWPWGAGTAY